MSSIFEILGTEKKEEIKLKNECIDLIRKIIELESQLNQEKRDKISKLKNAFHQSYRKIASNKELRKEDINRWTN